jgi:hypothetical protein
MYINKYINATGRLNTILFIVRNMKLYNERTSNVKASLFSNDKHWSEVTYAQTRSRIVIQH